MADFKEGEFEPQHVAHSDLGKAELEAAEAAAAEERNAGKSDEQVAPEGGKPSEDDKAQQEHQDTAGADDDKSKDKSGEKPTDKSEDDDEGKAEEEKTDLEQTEEQQELSKSARRRQRDKERKRELMSARDEALREAEKERQQREAAEQELAKLKGESQNDRPNRYDFSSDDEFNAAMDAWMDKEADRRAQAKNEQDAPRPTAQQVIRRDRAINVAAVGEEMFDDFKEVASNPSVPWSEPMLDEVLDLDPEDAARVTHHLSTHTADAQRLANLNGSALAREVGRLSARLDAEAQSSNNQTRALNAPGNSGLPPDKTGAPEPIKPVPGADAQVTDEDDLPINDWMQRQWKREGKM